MRKLFLLLSLSFFISSYGQTNIFNSLLKKHVDSKGNVNYKAFKNDEAKLQNYLNYLAKTSPQKNWSAPKTKAFWVNAYNAYTIKLILDNYPLKSITNIKKGGKDAWNIKFAKVGGKDYTLNHIEHEILRKKFNDPKIHVGVNCASGSCPQLGNFAFTEANYETKTNFLMKKFVNDPKRNKISEDTVQISKIFEWFKGDFTKKGSLINFLNKYSNTKISSKAKIKYLKYDWSLNGK
ncbi:Protein of unknown function, DUF547 [Tenacibaculum sp. MAR_2009_124]|uniref:DUF547 domain-containing protein n=1 Tax=Tenacibaculum sp. MAR_2009_124 TaxID=1250059 RepID=UPI0008959809|nr:DUF547 domain-containing protein [Tenacibaculum sp. MAR_2009_124]SEC55321.1 Protein of unknown function, DUF547 [Tenacibaculum sp. MAR_2009_124]